MKSRIIYSLFVAGLLVLQGCTNKLIVKNVNYAQHVESVLEPNSNGMVTDYRYGLSFNMLPFQYEEFNDSSRVLINQIRLIRNDAGFYFITADAFKHVYVMKPGDSRLMMEAKILVDDQGLENPAFNWRNPLVQIISKDKAESVFLNQHGIVNEKERSS